MGVGHHTTPGERRAWSMLPFAGASHVGYLFLTHTHISDISWELPLFVGIRKGIESEPGFLTGGATWMSQPSVSHRVFQLSNARAEERSEDFEFRQQLQPELGLGDFASWPSESRAISFFCRCFFVLSASKPPNPRPPPQNK